MSVATQIKIAVGIGVLGLVASIVLACADIALPGMSAESTTPAKVTYPATPAAADLTVSVLAPPDHLVRGARADLEIVFTNFSAKPQEIQLSWMANCFSFSPNQPLTVHVPATDSRMQRIDVEAVCDEGNHPIALYAQVGAPAATYKSLAAIAPVQMTAVWRLRLFRFLFLISAFLRALVVPAALALLAYFLDRKADAIKKDQADRDARLKDEQDDRERRSSMLRLLLPDYSTMVQKHYLPISRRMDSIEAAMPPLLSSIQEPLPAAELGKKMGALKAELDPAAPQVAQGQPAVAAAESPEVWKLLAAILLYRARLLSFLMATGGIYFRSNQAERLFGEIVDSFLDGLNAHLNKEDFREAAGLLDPEDELLSATRKLRSGEVTKKDPPTELLRKKKLFAGLYAALKKWIVDDPAGFRACSRLIQLASHVLSFECARPFYQTDLMMPVDLKNPAEPSRAGKSGWYFDPPLLDFSQEMYAIPADLQAALDPEISFYIENVPSECRKGAGFPFPRTKAAPVAAPRP